jgi:hypothetical protein
MSQTGKVILAFTGIFVAGAVAGGIVALRVGLDQAADLAQTAPATIKTPVTADTFTIRQMNQFVEKLGLSPAQSEKIQPIITATGERLKKLSLDSAAATKAALNAMDKQVESLLNADQLKQLAVIEKQREENFNKRKNGPPGVLGGRRGGGPGGTGTFSDQMKGMPRRGVADENKVPPSPSPAPSDQKTQP